MSTNKLPNINSIAVVGAGPSGLAAAKYASNPPSKLSNVSNGNRQISHRREALLQN